MRLVQTTIEVPTYGARILEPNISRIMTTAPHIKTTISSIPYLRKQDISFPPTVYELPDQRTSNSFGCPGLFELENGELYSLRFRCFDLMVRVFVGAASCRDAEPVAAGCRSYKNEPFNP
jgi:hypothetical protein